VFLADEQHPSGPKQRFVTAATVAGLLGLLGLLGLHSAPDLERDNASDACATPTRIGVPNTG
jgi:hypothetical protein